MAAANSPDPPVPAFGAIRAGACIVAIVAMMALDGIDSTFLAVNRGQVIGSLALVPDEVAWLGIAYLAAKIVAFALSPTLLARLGSWRVLMAAGLGLAVSTAALGFPLSFEPAIACRIAQGAFGAVVLVAGQMLVFAMQPDSRQPLLQATVALPVVVLPATLAPALHGWMTDAWSWQALFLPSGAVGLLACALLALAGGKDPPARSVRSVGPGIVVLLALAATGFVYVLQRGARYDWFDEPRFAATCLWTLLALAALVVALVRSKAALFSAMVFGNARFTFGFCATFAAGFILFGSASAILLFATSALQLDPAHAGQLIASSSIAVAAGLLVVGCMLQYARMPVELPIPMGIVLFMAGMWLLSHATPDSGREQLVAATWLRGLGMGTLFISLTMMTLGDLGNGLRVHGIALFNLGRQVGGLAGSAFVLSWLEWRVPAQATVLSQYLVDGRPVVDEARSMLATALVSRGMEAADGATAALAVLARMLGAQSAARAFDGLFLGFVAFFLFAVPVLVGIKLLLQLAVRRMRASQPQPGS